jgi:hypothetical protein
MKSAPDVSSTLSGPLYLIAVFLIVVPVTDFLGQIAPLQLGNVEWRFASVGLMSGFLLTPLLGIVLAIAVAAARKHVTVQRLIAIANGIFAIALLAALALFVLDTLQLGSVVSDEQSDAFGSAATRALVKHFAAMITLGWLARAGFRVAQLHAYEPPKRAADLPPIVVAKV